MEEKKVKTKAEIQKELADKKVAKSYLSEYEANIKTQLDGFLEELKKQTAKISDLKPDFNIKHSLDSLEEIKALKVALNSTERGLKEISIPNEIKVIRETKIDIKDKTRLFLIYFSGVAMLITAVSIYFVLDYKANYDTAYGKGWQKGILEGREQLYDILPIKTKKYIDQKYSKWKE